MDIIADRIKAIRKIHKLTSEQFAERILCTRKTVQRYENNKCLPDVYNLKKMALEFNVSTDYLLGLSNNMEKQYEAEDVTMLFQRYKQMALNPILNEDYYWIRFEVEEDRTYIRSTQTEWSGFTDNTCTKEIRTARKVIPQNAIELCKKINSIPVIINKVSEIGIFYLFGGDAMIREQLCIEHMPEILGPYVVETKEMM